MGIDPANLIDSQARIPYPLMLEAWRRAEGLLDDPCIGLRVLSGLEVRLLERIQHESEWIVPQLFAKSATVHQGLQRTARYFPIGFYGSQLLLSHRGGALHIRHAGPFGCDLPRSFSEFILGFLSMMIQEFSIRSVRLREACFRHLAPVCLIEH